MTGESSLIQTEKAMSDNNPYKVDVTYQTIRGRACPACGGKIIPSNRAIYESKSDPSAVYPLWECERCGYAEFSEKAKPEKGKHAK
jgi:ribosomal protein S27AE